MIIRFGIFHCSNAYSNFSRGLPTSDENPEHIKLKIAKDAQRRGSHEVLTSVGREKVPRSHDLIHSTINIHLPVQSPILFAAHHNYCRPITLFPSYEEGHPRLALCHYPMIAMLYRGQSFLVEARLYGVVKVAQGRGGGWVTYGLAEEVVEDFPIFGTELGHVG